VSELPTETLEGRVAVVTGGGAGLGEALARMFAGAGMAVAVLDIDEEAAAAVAKSIASVGASATSVPVDVGNSESVAAAAEHVRATLGACHVLCSNVGVQQFGTFERLTEQDWSWVLDVNVMGAVRSVREFLPMMRAATGFRHLLFTASSSVLAPSVRMACYQTSKFAVLGLAESLREELGSEGIGVTTLFPAAMLTGHLDSSVRARPVSLGDSRLDQADVDAMLAHQPIGPDDVTSPEHAIRNLLADLKNDEPYVMTHGSHRSIYEQRRVAMDAAFDRMENS
jgi:NAD(P)-dependent dehydrogenase (short-subunit alcohol dehydrogenase family)